MSFPLCNIYYREIFTTMFTLGESFNHSGMYVISLGSNKFCDV